MIPTSALLFFTILLPSQPATGNFYHDFRSGKPLPTELTLFGPNAAQVVKSEEGGLHVTPPPNGQLTGGWGVALKFALTGDFEVTGTYEFLSAAPPLNGAGCGVALNALPVLNGRKFTKLGRFLRMDEGNIYVAEFWNKDQPNTARRTGAPTETRAGKLRLARNGSVMHYLVADTPNGEFREIAAWEFGPEDLSMVRFIVNNNGSPTAVEARLVDLKVTGAQAPLSVNREMPANQETAADPQPKSRTSLMLMWGLLAAALLIAVGVRVVMRRRVAAIEVPKSQT
jgi:Protein of unknown function (DUF1583)